MKNKITYYLLVLNVLFNGCVFSKDFPTTNKEIVSLVKEIVTEDPENTKSVTEKLYELKDKKPKYFSEKEVLKIVKTVLSCNLSDSLNNQKEQLAKIKKYLIKTLKQYEVSGVAHFAFDPNFAFIFDSQNPSFTVDFKDRKGNIKRRKYLAEINSIGFKFEAAIKFDLIFLVNTDTDFYETKNAIELGYGVDMGFGWGVAFGLTYVPFENISGGILILSFPILFAVPSLSLVTGGYLTPVK